MNMTEIAMNLIDEDKDQPRYQFGEEALRELMESIEELGLLSPIKVRTTPGGRYKIIYGNRRYKACEMLGRETIPCIVSDVTDEMEIYLEQIAENLTREGFSPIEEAEAFDKLLNNPKFKSSTKYLSNKLGKPESYIKNKCELLKFGRAVKKLIVGGTEIRKDLLTEEQLLPLKDLPLEYRDTLALTIARDEMPVSDVKKIAKLFKAKDITENTKSKLLYKSGPGLIETWSVHEHNKAERAKAAEAKAAAEAEAKAAAEQAAKEQQAKAVQAAAEAGAAAAPAPEAQPAAPAAAAAPQAAAPQAPAAPSAPGGEALLLAHTPASPAQPSPSPALGQVQRMLAALPQTAPLRADVIRSLGTLPAAEREEILAGIDSLIGQLENHLLEWKSVREQAKATV
ncbi:ParB/RepB/Spo0J family partition protein [Paenibacillus mucilaginosus]|uniref:ParB/RepB/Spo0J family partition protein n=1 Tax=Paenibacillus mucilaginosus TaxID=61624 RepID=UPI001EEFAADA|nr:ParB/RepB/Spo0J family partition protein [Paenibacillus mucilaginosus]MCG7212629.1 ParB/RepB/Spo0J family partition protein [Paenibacillus mucilaginosus]WDM25349.1 ParB/RepB/Spo0J family partition protein [Paenibacillus mucilaginosus]